MTEIMRSNVEAAHEPGHPVRALGSALHQTWWLALGIAATIGETASRMAGPLMEKGRNVEPSVFRPIRRVASEVGERAEGATSRLREAASRIEMPGTREDVGLPSKEEFQKLVEEVRELRARLLERSS